MWAEAGSLFLEDMVRDSGLRLFFGRQVRTLSADFILVVPECRAHLVSRISATGWQVVIGFRARSLIGHW